MRMGIDCHLLRNERMVVMGADGFGDLPGRVEVWEDITADGSGPWTQKGQTVVGGTDPRSGFGYSARLAFDNDNGYLNLFAGDTNEQFANLGNPGYVYE